ncbi:Forkhead associated (FHA) domain, binds pSer, pThr, pTyr [Eubacterium ruminantium]|nr:Forkhead associated (FHA) domain, binds pSer, pThr, pTyr [Eubacterium ruminantium]
MRSFSFTAKNIGDERYLTYVIGDGTELDEDVLDFMEEESLDELVKVIYEEDEEFDYLTFDVSGKMELAEFVKGSMNKGQVFTIIRNIALGLMTLKEEAVRLSYILLNKKFIYIDPDSYNIQFLCLPVESDGSLSIEFKGFVRQLIANMKFNVNEDLAYIGQMLTYINSDAFNLRGLISLTEALMADSGIGYDEQGSISADDGSEIVNSDAGSGDGVGSYMDGLEEGDGNLPEIGDDEEEGEDNVEQVDFDSFVESVEEGSGELTADMAPGGQTDNLSEEEIKERIEEIVNKKEPRTVGLTEYLKNEELDEVVPNRPHVQTKNIKVNRAALVQSSASDDSDGIEVTEESRKRDSKDEVIENIEDAAGEKKGSGTLAKVQQAGGAILGLTGTLNINPYIIRVNTEERVVINKSVFKIGKANRGVDYSVTGNGAISRQHAIITKKDDGYYIKDNKSTNHTYVNNEQLEEGQEVLLKNNTKIKLGDEEFLFKLG